MIKKSAILSLLFFLLLLSQKLYSYETPIEIQSLRAMGMGGAFVAIADDQYAIYQNPAGVAGMEENYLTVFEITPIVNFDLIEILVDQKWEALMRAADAVTADNGGQEISDEEAEFIASLPFMNAGLDIFGPVHINWSGSGIGIGIFNDINMDIIMDSTGMFPELSDLHLMIDAGIYAGYALEIPLPFMIGKRDFFYLGMAVKFLYRADIHKSDLTLPELADIIENFSLSSAVRTAKGIKIGPGVGADIGILWKWPSFSIGFVAYDFFGTRFSWKLYDESLSEYADLPKPPDTMIFPSFSIGVAYRIRKIPYIPAFIIKNITIAFDFQDFADYQGDHWAEFLTKLHLGLEFTTLGFIKLRGGINGGYFTAGLGFYLTVFIIEAAIWTEELGIQPGQLSQTRVGFNFAIRI